MRSSINLSLLASLPIVATLACSSASPPPCPSGTQCVWIPAGTSEDDIQADFNTIADDTVIQFGEGTFKLTNTLVVAKNGVTVEGAGMDKTILDFKGQKAGSEGVFAQSVQNITLQGFTVQDTTGNAIKVLGGTGVTFRQLKTLWTADDPTTHGGYGLYPVQSKNVLVENCTAIGGSDSGIYLGQSDHAVIRNNEVFQNVAGIEVENTYFTDVYGNLVHDNAVGISVFDLPGLQQLGGHDVRIYDNQILHNNTDNFSAPGNTLGLVPRGTGFLVMANSNVEVFGNTIADNQTGNSAVLSYFVTQQPIQDPNYYPFPSNVYIHDNTLSGGGDLPDLKKQIGLLLASAEAQFPNNAVPSLLFDGVEDPAKAQQTPQNPMQICYQNNGAAAFVDLHIDKLDPNAPNLPAVMTQDVTPYTCTLPSLPPVTFPGLTN